MNITFNKEDGFPDVTLHSSITLVFSTDLIGKEGSIITFTSGGSENYEM